MLLAQEIGNMNVIIIFLYQNIVNKKYDNFCKKGCNILQN